MLTSLEWQTLEQRRRISRLVMMYKINSWTSTETYTPYLVTAEPEVNIGSSRRGPIMTLSETPSKEQHENGTTYQTPQLGPAPQRSSGLTSNNRLATPISVNSFNCVIVKCLVVHNLGDISCVCLVPQNLKQSATTPVLHWKKKKIHCGCTCVYDLLIVFSKFLTERHVHTSIRQQSESVGLSCQNLNLSILHIFKSMI